MTLAQAGQADDGFGLNKIYLSKNGGMEATDYFGQNVSMKLQGKWESFYDESVAEHKKPNAQKTSVFSGVLNGVRYRCLLANSLNGYGLSMRRINEVIPDLETDLLLDWRVIKPLLMGTGLTIFAGPMGGGKSTTLASALMKLTATERGRLGTVEDPIENIFNVPFVIQRQIGEHSESFALAIKDFVRMDCETIMVSEIRDPETANAAIQVASSGHRVVATVHADSAIDAITRMLALADERYAKILPRCLRGLWWQEVVRFGNKTRRPLPVYESLEVTNVVRQIIQGGPDKFHHLEGEMSNQGRRTMKETAEHWRSVGRMTTEEIKKFSY